MIEIVFENSHFVFCDKPGGVLSTPSRFKEDDSRFCLGTVLQEKLQIQIYPIHRLDFEVSGLVMYAKTAEGHRIANGWFENKQVQKTYRALTTGQDFSHIPANIMNNREKLKLETGASFEWKSFLLRGKRRAYEHRDGKPSTTIAKFLGVQQQGYQEWDLQPVTGRSHQLRFDLSRHGFPIVGDILYGSKIELNQNSIALRSYEIDFSKSPGAEALSLPDKIVIPHKQDNIIL